MEGSHIIIL